MVDRPTRGHARILVASLAGTSIEFYDFFIYATAAALVFGKLFFPGYSQAAQTLLAFVTFGVAFVARPIGAIAFGHFGDRIGRKSTLVASLMMMGVSTLLIGFLPTYAQAGWIAPALLCLLRFGQGFGLGGEWGGAALLAIENAPKGWQARFGAVPQLGVAVGFLSATGVFLILGAVLAEKDFLAWGWRVPFIASAVLVLLGLWIRLKISETPEFRAAIAREPPLQVPAATLLGRHFGTVVAGSAGVVSTYALFYFATAFALAQTTAGPQGFPRQTILIVQIVANLFYAGGIVLSSLHSDRTSPGTTIRYGALATAVVGLFFSAALASHSLPLVAAMLMLSLFVLAFNNAPLGSWLSSLFPVRVRYSGVSLTFNTGGILGGALMPILAQSMVTAGTGAYAGLLLTAGGAVTFFAVLLARPASR